MHDILIVGKGPAGISAAIYAARAGLNTLVVGKDGGALSKAAEVENYYGFSDPLSGKALLQNGIKQAHRLGAQIISDEIVGFGFEDAFVANGLRAKYAAKTVILATGAARQQPKIKRVTELEGYGVSYCAVCDAFFFRGKDVAVLGSGEYAMHEAATLLPLANSVTLLTDGKPLTAELLPELKLEERKMDELLGEKKLAGVRFADGDNLAIDGLFVAIGVASSTDLARKIGVYTENNRIPVEETMATNIPGLYAAGDCTGGLLQIAKAVYEGAQAATNVIKYLRENG